MRIHKSLRKSTKLLRNVLRIKSCGMRVPVITRAATLLRMMGTVPIKLLSCPCLKKAKLTMRTVILRMSILKMGLMVAGIEKLEDIAGVHNSSRPTSRNTPRLLRFSIPS